MKLCNDILITKNRAIAKSYAKINLSLDVLGILENGYHSVEMIMQSINLFDLIIIDKQQSGISLSSNIKHLPTNSANIAYKAAELFFSETGISGGAKILIHKNIPIAAGLAGGSGNAAAVLCALNLLYDANLDDNKLCEIALNLGADVPYCISGGTQLAQGIGEKLTPLPQFPTMPVLLVKPPISVSTAHIYHKIDSAQNLTHPDTGALLSALRNQDVNGVCKNMSNIMETVTADECEEITKIKQDMLSYNALGSVMSGSGPTVFGIFPDNGSAQKAFDFFAAQYDEVFLAHTTA